MSGSIENIKFRPYTAKFAIFEEAYVSNMRISNRAIHTDFNFDGYDVANVASYILDCTGSIYITDAGSKFESIAATLTLRSDAKDILVLEYSTIRPDWIKVVNTIFGMDFAWEALCSAHQ